MSVLSVLLSVLSVLSVLLSVLQCIAAYCQVKLLTNHCMSTRTYESISMSRPMCCNTVNSVSVFTVLLSVFTVLLSVFTVLLSVLHVLLDESSSRPLSEHGEVHLHACRCNWNHLPKFHFLYCHRIVCIESYRGVPYSPYCSPQPHFIFN